MNFSNFVPRKSHLQHLLFILFHQKKKGAEALRLLVETSGKHDSVIRTCETCFRQFKSGYFDLTDDALHLVGSVLCDVLPKKVPTSY